MSTKSVFYTTSILTLLAACGGSGGGGGDVVQDGPVSGAEVASVFGSIDSALAGSLLSGDTTIDETTAEMVLDDITPVDVTVAGSANYDGVIAISDIDSGPLFDPEVSLEVAGDALFESDPTFLILGRSTIDVTFGSDPEISGGADGFIGMNADDILAIDVSDFPTELTESTVASFINSLPTVDVDGSLTYSNASVFDLSDLGIAELPNGLAFDVDGNLVLTGALTGLGSTQNVTVDGNGVAVFTNVLAGGLVDLGSSGGTPDLPLSGLIIGVAE
ncbi:MAG: hypothetical protein AAFQ64_00905 [Pseudomonadota bacterium]